MLWNCYMQSYIENIIATATSDDVFTLLKNKMLLDDFLSSDAFTMVNKKLAKTIWIWQAIYLQELISQRKRFKQDEFYFTQDSMENELWISVSTQNRYCKELQKLWIIIVQKKWIPAKNWYKINDDVVIKLINKSIQNESTGNFNSNVLVPSNWGDYSNNNIIIKNNNKKLLFNDEEYKFVEDFLDRSNSIVEYCFNKYPNYLETQYEAVDKLIKQWYTLETIKTVLKFVKQDQFWNKNILSVKKLLEKNKDWIQYMIVMIEKIKNYKPKCIDLDSL